MSKPDSARLEELLDWLADAVAARLRAAEGEAGLSAPRGADEARPSEPAPLPAAKDPALAEPIEPQLIATAEAAAPADAAEALPLAPQPSHAARLLSRLVIGLLAAVLLINIPFGRGGAALARMIPSSTTLVIRDGLLVKEAGKPEVYVYEGGKFRWITSLDVFERYRYRWENVHEVRPGFLADYELGRPVYLVAKCPDSPHIYRIENGARRWIVDIAAFEAEGHVWEDVQFYDCRYLAGLPDGETIPPGNGPAPQP